MKLLVTRHGQTDWNVQKKVMGRCDIPLNKKGIEQAEEIREKIDENIDLVICSPLSRAKQTAQIINKNIPIIYDERIIERDFGQFEGKEIKDFDFDEFWNYYKNARYEKAENIQVFFNRVYEFLDDVIEKYSDKTILIVTHGGVSIPIACYFNKNIPEGSLVSKGLALDNCQVASYNIEKTNKIIMR